MQTTIHFDDTDIVNHAIPMPYYFQLSSYLERKIKAKEFLPGQLMPSEQEICEKVGISRTVVRQAMTDLERKGLITKQSGKRSQFHIYLMRDGDSSAIGAPRPTFSAS